MKYEEPPSNPEQENPDRSPGLVAKEQLSRAIQNILDSVRSSLEPGHDIAWVSLEITFKNKTLRTRSDQDAEESRWGQLIHEVASTLGIPEYHIIDPYGSGDGGTVSFQLRTDADAVQEIHKIGFDGRPTGELKKLKQSLGEITVDIDGVGITQVAEGKN